MDENARMKEAMEKYIAGGVTLKELAAEMGVPEGRMRAWSSRGHWADKRNGKESGKPVARASGTGRLREASDEAESALLLAARAVNGQMEAEPAFSQSVSGIVDALHKQTMTRLMLKKLAAPKQEKKESCGLVVKMEKDAENLAE